MLNKLTDKRAIRKALAEFDHIGRYAFLEKYGFAPSREYLIEHRGRHYDSKAIAGVAFGYAFPKLGPLKSKDFVGGDATVKKQLEKLGFTVSRFPNYKKHKAIGPHVTLVRHVAMAVNLEAANFRIGALQTIRSHIRQKRKSGSKIFSEKSVKERYAFHSGGRDELQFNIGEEAIGKSHERFRWGVAFSFEPSRSFPNPSVLSRNVRFFNDYISAFFGEFSDMTMWMYEGGRGPTNLGLPKPIDPSLIRNHVFVFLGKYTSKERINPIEILTDFDRLLPLYEYVESGATVALKKPTTSTFVFRSGHKKKSRKALASTVARELEMDLRHEGIQEALHELLAKKYGRGNAGTEQICVSGNRIDAVVKRDTGFWFYEIKTSSSPRMCLREAVGQLLEYCLWPGGVPAERLIVVGESPLDAEAKAYLTLLNTKLSIPLEYLAVKAIS